jgi:hypothetical protein
MTPERYIIIALSIACAVLAWIAFGPSPDVPPVDPERYRTEERMRLKDVELEVARITADAANRRYDSLHALPRIIYTRNDEPKHNHWSLSDSLSAIMALEILSANLPDTVRGEVGRVAE